MATHANVQTVKMTRPIPIDSLLLNETECHVLQTCEYTNTGGNYRFRPTAFLAAPRKKKDLLLMESGKKVRQCETGVVELLSWVNGHSLTLRACKQENINGAEKRLSRDPSTQISRSSFRTATPRSFARAR
jgi:hypothetical protein